MDDTPHSAFPETADIETSSEAYAARFAGAAGRWMLAEQERIVRLLLGPGNGRTILDVGGGHGQLAGPLLADGWRVSVASSAPECVARLQPHVAEGRITFRVCNLLAMPFPDRGFETVTCIRYLTHCRRWRDCVRELCRVAGRQVLLDYPAIRSINALTPALFAAKRRVEGNTRPYVLFRHGVVADAFRDNGFRPAARVHEFFWPMVCHRMLGRPGVSGALEQVARVAGLTRLFGSPALARFERVGD